VTTRTQRGTLPLTVKLSRSAGSTEIETRAADYRARLTALEAQVRSWLDAVPRAQRRVITAHDAFGYFGAAYGVDFLAPQGWTTRSEPSAAWLSREGERNGGHRNGRLGLGVLAHGST